MSEHPFEAFSRGAVAGVSRRGSLGTLSAAALATALMRPEIAAAGKAGKKARKRCKKQAQKCRDDFAAACADRPDPEECRMTFTPCCEPLSRCDAGPAVICVVAVF